MEGRRLEGRRKREATRILDRHPDPVTQADRCPLARAATAVAGRSSRQCLHGHLPSQADPNQADLSRAGWVRRVAAAARWADPRQAVRAAHKSAAVTDRRVVQAQKAGATVEAATVRAPTV